jgi:hypothetical protein
MALVMPTRTDAARYTFEMELDGVTFGFTFNWNERAGAWFFSIADVNGVPLLSGRRVVVNFPLLARFRDPRLPAGDLEAVDTSGEKLDPGLADLGARVRLLYMPIAELPSLMTE